MQPVYTLHGHPQRPQNGSSIPKPETLNPDDEALPSLVYKGEWFVACAFGEGFMPK